MKGMAKVCAINCNEWPSRPWAKKIQPMTSKHINNS
jgi:hypothetical protein